MSYIELLDVATFHTNVEKGSRESVITFETGTTCDYTKYFFLDFIGSESTALFTTFIQSVCWNKTA